MKKRFFVVLRTPQNDRKGECRKAGGNAYQARPSEQRTVMRDAPP